MSAALHQAQRWRLISRAVTDLASPPPVRTDHVAATDPTVVRRLLEAADEANPVLAVAIAMAAVTGARRGELCGLRWSDVDRAGVLHIRRAVKATLEGPEVVVGDTKTHAHRRIALDPLITAILGRHRAKVEQIAAAVGFPLSEDAYVISLDPTGGEPMKPASLGQAYSRLARRLGIKLRFHDLRHFAATQLIGAGVDVGTVAGRLGHADATTTLRVYTHALEEKDRAGAHLLGRLVLQSGPSRTPSTGTSLDLASANLG